MRVNHVSSNRVVRLARVNDLRFWLVLILSLAMTGCISSPASSVSRRAVKAAMKDRLDKFRDQLTPEARSTLGTQRGMGAMHQKLAGYTNVTVGEALVTSAKQGDQGYDHYGDVLRMYEATVSGSAAKDAPPELIYTLQVQCTLAYGVYHHDETSESCSTTIDQNGVPWTNCTPGTPAYDSIDLGESCAVAGIK
jgi:hypothetical protein